MGKDTADAPALGIKSVAITETRSAVVGPLQIADFGIEVRSHLPVGGGHLMVTVIVTKRRKTGVVSTRQARRFRLGVIVLPVGVASQTHVGISAKCAVKCPFPLEMGKRLPVDGNQAYAGTVWQLTLDACDGEVIGGGDAVDLTSLHVQKPDLIRAGMAA